MGPDLDRSVEVVRQFHRTYSAKWGFLDEKLLGTEFGLVEARLIYELAAHPGITAKELAGRLSVHPGYLSRLLKRLEASEVLEKLQNESDRRAANISLTPSGYAAFQRLNEASNRQAATVLSSLSPGEATRLVSLLGLADRILAAEPPAAPLIVIREPYPGDFGWIIHRQGRLYWEEYRWNEEFEGLVAQIVGDFIANRDPAIDRCWVAELDNQVVGSVFLVKGSEAGTAKLRLLYVEPSARGLGIGRRLVQACLDHARSCGCTRVVLWTNSLLDSARRIYQEAGFELVEEEQHHSFGHDLTGQTWSLNLAP